MRAPCLARRFTWFTGFAWSLGALGLLGGVGCTSTSGRAAAREAQAAVQAGPPKGSVAPLALFDEPTAPLEAGACCAPHGGSGCADAAVSECVCAGDPGCCDGSWDGLCVLEVEALGCGACGLGGSCCAPHGAGGCDDDPVRACVCAEDSYCCDGEWDELCVAAVTRLGCGGCDDGGGAAACCLPHGGPGCVDPAVAACVCAQNPYCCEDLWDESCVAAVDSLGCGICEGSDGCCDGHDGPGCADPTIESCVCDAAPGCCTGAWDEVCAGLVEVLGCGACEPPPPAECCAAHPAAGCDEVVVESCVCAELPACCEGPWTDACAAAVDALGCGLCEGAQACCLAHEGGGCESDEIEACVCAEDPYCCSASWDDACVLEVETFGCGRCEDEAPCCDAHDGGGCDDLEIAACVCAQDAPCCAVAWDETCAQEVTGLGCGACG